MTDDEEARAAIAAIRSPGLDALRARIPTMRTSEIIATMVGADLIVDACADPDEEEATAPPRPPRYTRDEHVAIWAAGIHALSDELDRRIPVPKDPAR